MTLQLVFAVIQVEIQKRVWYWNACRHLNLLFSMNIFENSRLFSLCECLLLRLSYDTLFSLVEVAHYIHAVWHIENNIPLVAYSLKAGGTKFISTFLCQGMRQELLSSHASCQRKAQPTREQRSFLSRHGAVVSRAIHEARLRLFTRNHING